MVLSPALTSVSTDPASSSLAQSVMSMASSQISTDTVSSMSGSYIAPGTEEEGEALPSPRAASRAPSEGEVREEPLICLLSASHTRGWRGSFVKAHVLAGRLRGMAGRRSLRSGSVLRRAVGLGLLP